MTLPKYPEISQSQLIRIIVNAPLNRFKSCAISKNGWYQTLTSSARIADLNEAVLSIRPDENPTELSLKVNDVATGFPSNGAGTVVFELCHNEVAYLDRCVILRIFRRRRAYPAWAPVRLKKVAETGFGLAVKQGRDAASTPILLKMGVAGLHRFDLWVFRISVLRFLQKIADFFQENFLPGRCFGSWRFFELFTQMVHDLDQKESDPGNNHEIQTDLQEFSVTQNDLSLAITGSPENPPQAGKVNSCQSQTNRRHENVIHQTGHNLTEGATDNHTHSHIHDIAADSKFPEFLNDFHLSRGAGADKPREPLPPHGCVHFQLRRMPDSPHPWQDYTRRPYRNRKNASEQSIHRYGP